MSLHKIAVHVALKPGVLDPEGQAVQDVLRREGYPVTAVRMGRRIEVEVDAPTEIEARRAVEEMARQVLANPVLEHYWIETAR
jgi:phosphoribosylformylglycinamidine synthase PurS subunit